MMYIHLMGRRIEAWARESTTRVCHCLKMRRSAENVIHFYDTILAPSGVTVRQYSLLNAIAEHRGCNVRALAEITLLDRSTLQEALSRLSNLIISQIIKRQGPETVCWN